MPEGYSLYKMQEGGGTRGGSNESTDNRSRGIYPQGERGAPTPYSNRTAAGNDPLQSIIDLINSAGGGTAGSSQSSGSTVVLPPVLELLAEMRARRESEAAQASSIGELLMTNLPRGQTYYPGMEPGGLADVLLGIITGQGPSVAQQILPEGQRLVRRTEVPIPQGQPPVAEEAGGAMGIAQAILDALRNIQTSQSSSSSSPVG